MKRESHLFACHKFLEEVGSKILTHLAKVDFRNLQKIEVICNEIQNYVATLENHARWEEEFIFNKFFTNDEVLSFFKEHSDLEVRAQNIIEGLKALLNTDIQSRVCKGKRIYLDFRIFYASNLVHFHREETIFLSLLQERATDNEIKMIDKPIYESMSSADMVEMLKLLLPPTNISEKKNILDDLMSFNPVNFKNAIPEIRKILTKEEVAELITPKGCE